MKCPKCGAVSSDNADFCSLCQTSFPSAGKESSNPENTARPPEEPVASSSDLIEPSVPLIFENSVTKDERLLGMIAHLTYFVFNILGPLIIWLVQRDKSNFVGNQAKEALNFQISIVVYSFILGLLAVFFHLIFALGIVAVSFFGVILAIMGAIKSYHGEDFSYPMSIAFVG